MFQLLSFLIMLGFKLVLFVFASFAVATYAPGFMLDVKEVIPNAIDAALEWGPIVMGEIEDRAFEAIDQLEAPHAHAESVEFDADNQEIERF